MFLTDIEITKNIIKLRKTKCIIYTSTMGELNALVESQL